MYIYQNFVVATFISYVFGEQYKYIFVHEKFAIEYFDNNLVDATGELFDVNQTKALNASVTPKIDLPDDIMIHGAALRWINNGYSPAVIQMSKSITQVLDMARFDLDTLIKTFRPPLVWPMQKGVTYRTVGWIPDVTKFPPNLPSGKWKVQITFTVGNEPKIGVVGWYLKLVYKN